MPISKVTTGSITDSVAIDTDTLVVDSTNNRVGIGTSSPSQKLEVNGNAVIGGSLYVDGSASNLNYQLDLSNSDTEVVFYASRDSGVSKSYRFFTSNTGASERLRIDSSGRVTMPSQPVFFAYNLNFPGSNSAGTASGGSVLVNVGSHYATGTGRFTAPIAGTYVFYMMTQSFDAGNTSGQYQTAVFQKNGSIVGAEAYHGWAPPDGNNHVQVQNTVIITLAANDYMMAYVQYGSRDIQNYFGGYLLG